MRSWHEKTVIPKDKAAQNLNSDSDLILDFYVKEIRPLTEHGVAIWNSGLTKGQIIDLEKIQKTALKIILGEKLYFL